jgi:shikimate kinase
VSTRNARHVVLLGLMASGKSTVGWLLADRLGRPFVDNDGALEALAGRSARVIADADGADALHALEAESLADALAATVPAVVAAAASVVEQPAAVDAIRTHDSVYLYATPDVLAARVAAYPEDDEHRPFVDGDARAVLEAQYAARDLRYRALAEIIVDSSSRAPAAVVDEITRGLARAGQRTPPAS